MFYILLSRMCKSITLIIFTSQRKTKRNVHAYEELLYFIV